jgi:hypothetical protein
VLVCRYCLLSFLALLAQKGQILTLLLSYHLALLLHTDATTKLPPCPPLAAAWAARNWCALAEPPAACVSIRQYTSAYVSIRQHTSAYARNLCALAVPPAACVSIRQHTSAYVSICSQLVRACCASSSAPSSLDAPCSSAAQVAYLVYLLY